MITLLLLAAAILALVFNVPIQICAIVGIVVFGTACIAWFLRGGKLPPSSFDVLILAVLTLSGCGGEYDQRAKTVEADRVTTGTPSPPFPPSDMLGVPDADQALGDLRAELATLRGQVAEKQSLITDRENIIAIAKRDAALAPLRALTTWAAWIGGAVALLGVVALVLVRVGVPWLPIGGRLCIGVSLAGLALSAAALGLGEALPWLGPIGIGALVLAVLAGLVMSAMSWKRGGHAAAREWSAYASHLPEEVRAHLDAGSQGRQGAEAVIVSRLLAHGGDHAGRACSRCPPTRQDSNA